MSMAIDRRMCGSSTMLILLQARRNSVTLFPNYRKERGLEIYVDKGWNIHTSVPIRWISSGARESRVDMMVVECKLEGHP